MGVVPEKNLCSMIDFRLNDSKQKHATDRDEVIVNVKDSGGK